MAVLGRWRVALSVWLAFSTVVAPVSFARGQDSPPAVDEDLARARSLFAEALRDEQGHRFEEALGKFERVRSVRDTAAVEYRIASCLEGLHRPVAAFAAYRSAITLANRDPQSVDVVAAAEDRLRALTPLVAEVTLALPEAIPSDLEVRVDGVLVAPAAVREPLVLEPGIHVITASSATTVPARQGVVVSPGSRVTLTLSLEPALQVASPTPLEPAAQVAPRTSDAPRMDSSVVPPSSHQAPTVAWIATFGGLALLATSGVLLVARSNDIASLNHACPDGVCQASSDRDALEATRQRALVEGPLAGAAGAIGVAAAGIGAYFLWSARDRTAVTMASRTASVRFFAPGLIGLGVAGDIP
jgi:hypothetical protein